MNGPGNTFVTVDFHGEARMDFEHFQDDEEDGLTFAETVSNPVNVDITPTTGHIELVSQAATLEGHGSVKSSMTGTLTTDPKAVNVPILAPEEPPDLLWTPFAKNFMSPRKFISDWLPNIADMHWEYSEYWKRGDRLGAWWAVVRAHFYSLPQWLLAIPGLFLLNKIRQWLGF
jgi:hypothetical protein